jgi:hypothetical protein
MNYHTRAPLALPRGMCPVTVDSSQRWRGRTLSAGIIGVLYA